MSASNTSVSSGPAPGGPASGPKSRAGTAAFQIATADDNSLRASGAITFANATQTLARLPDARGPVDVDLSRVLNADSATLSVLIAWAARARARGGSLRYLNAPAGLHNLARLSDLDALLFGAGA
jgi:ABC-type transporter Mla MlaB component